MVSLPMENGQLLILTGEEFDAVQYGLWLAETTEPENHLNHGRMKIAKRLREEIEAASTEE